jgi:CBS domain-containing protein
MLPRTVQEVMTPNPVTIEVSSPLPHAATAMRDHDEDWRAAAHENR